jgi:GMP synthase-like glutamine amidotransferase
VAPPSGFVLQTQANCPPGLLAGWAAGRGIPLDVLRVDRWRDWPDPSNYSFAVALGSDESLAGPPSGWVAHEIEWLERADAAGVPVLGICFGAQALAVALGGSVSRLIDPERAWIEVDTEDPGRVPAGPWLALHEDSIEPPPSAQGLGRYPTGAQAVAIGPHLGGQVNPPATRGVLSRWIADKRDTWERVSGAVLATTLLDGARRLGSSSAAAALELFDGFAAHAGLVHASAPGRAT